jgi:mxaJ protein
MSLGSDEFRVVRFEFRVLTRSAAVAALTLGLGVAAPHALETRTSNLAPRALRVCSDPNNLPFSNERREGFENRLAELMARDLGMRVEYTWWPQRRGFIRNTLRAGRCDVVLGVPAAFELARTTRPYYRSTYVFVTRAGGGPRVGSLDDPRLRHLRIGIHVIGDDYANTPAAQALARRGIVENVVGYSIYGDYSKPNPPADLVRAVADGKVDVAIVWGPLAGYFAKRSTVPLRVVPVSPQIDLPFTMFVFDISMGVRRSDTTTFILIEQELKRRRTEIRRILEEYGVPLVERHGG